jgi:hypothetical protein
MVTWNSQWPIGNKSVKFNKDPGVQNTEYTETIMNLDHHWNDSTNTDGHHKWMQMPQQGTPAVPTDPSLATGMDGVIFAKATDVLNSYQDVQPFFKNNADIGTPGVTNLMQMLGMRSCAVFDGRSSDGACTLKYQFNIKPDPGAGTSWGIRRLGTGNYKIWFNTALPSANYLVHGGYAGQTFGHFVVSNNLVPGITLVKTDTFCLMEARTLIDRTVTDPTQLWFFCFGG